MDNEKVSRDECKNLLRKAIREQTNFRLHATGGQGCDRHMLGMYCASRELGMDVPTIFRDKVKIVKKLPVGKIQDAKSRGKKCYLFTWKVVYEYMYNGNRFSCRPFVHCKIWCQINSLFDAFITSLFEYSKASEHICNAFNKMHLRRQDINNNGIERIRVFHYLHKFGGWEFTANARISLCFVKYMINSAQKGLSSPHLLLPGLPVALQTVDLPDAHAHWGIRPRCGFSLVRRWLWCRVQRGLWNQLHVVWRGYRWVQYSTSHRICTRFCFYCGYDLSLYIHVMCLSWSFQWCHGNIRLPQCQWSILEILYMGKVDL